MEKNIIEGYTTAALELIPRFEAVSPEILFAPIAHLFPSAPAQIADIGAGTGAAAAWFANHGQQVLAVEPVADFRKAGRRLHKSKRIEWLDDALPDLPQTLARSDTFDIVLLSAVWHHLDSRQRRAAMPKLQSLIAPKGLLVISLRNGPGSPSRPCYESHPEELVSLARAENLKLTFKQEAESVQKANRSAGVTWTWLAFSKEHNT
ncbi:MAG: class I SAM-dependent methyltransferase [Rhodobacteraceae bacterium]|nr:class I SAM-dependent methyltransferase [Paracoccaceae bacterium]